MREIRAISEVVEIVATKTVRIALFAPRVMSKAIGDGGDAIILDLEDSAPVAAKLEARSLIVVANGAQVAAAAEPSVYI